MKSKRYTTRTTNVLSNTPVVVYGEAQYLAFEVDTNFDYIRVIHNALQLKCKRKY